MDDDSFDEIDLPNPTVTEPNPAHALAFRRFSSDQAVRFNRAQVENLRRHTDAPIVHTYIGRITDFDYFALGADLDITARDVHPPGFLRDRLDAPIPNTRPSCARAPRISGPSTTTFAAPSAGAGGG